MPHGVVQTGISFPDGSIQTSAAAAEQGVFYVNNQNVVGNFTLQTGKNAMTAGPITVDSGVTVTISTDSRWVIV